MTRFRIVVVTAAAVIALTAWWVPLKVGGGYGCASIGACVEGPPAPGGSGVTDRFFGGEGGDRIRGSGDHPQARDGIKRGDVMRCGPDRYGASTDAGAEPPHSCEDIPARFY